MIFILLFVVLSVLFVITVSLIAIIPRLKVIVETVNKTNTLMNRLYYGKLIKK